jgi:hypothetical protein
VTQPLAASPGERQFAGSTMTRPTKVLIGIFGVLMALCLFCCVLPELVLPLFNPLRRSPEKIRASVLKESPLGTSRERVDALVNNRGWSRGWTNDGPADYADPSWISAFLGKYSDYVSETMVYVFWKFDKDDRLIEIRVIKSQLGI